MKAVKYFSESLLDMDNQQLADMSKLFALKNSAKNITGYLYFHNGVFFQYFEGDEDSVSQLMLTIEQDNRHRVIEKYEEHALEKRRFPYWNMQYIGKSILNLEQFDPYDSKCFDYLNKILNASTKNQ